MCTHMDINIDVYTHGYKYWMCTHMDINIDVYTHGYKY